MDVQGTIKYSNIDKYVMSKLKKKQWSKTVRTNKVTIKKVDTRKPLKKEREF
jgi:hypothetical protein